MRNLDAFSNRQAVTPVILAAAIAALVWYLLLLFNPGNISNPVAYGLLLAAEMIAVVQVLGAWVTVLLGPPRERRDDVLAAKDAMLKKPAFAGKVAVFVPVSGEPLEVIMPTLTAARDIALAHETYVLDDGKSDETKALASRLGIGYLRRGDRTGWKAGNINHALKSVECDYFAILDSDHVAFPEFLTETLPWLLADPKVAFVQTPQHLVNREGFVSGGIAESQEVFYRHIQNCKNRFNAAFCVGTNVLFRASAVRGIGGIYDKSRCEDIWTSLLLHEAGWTSVYLPVVLAHGQAPDTIDGFLRQQFRWASGGYELLFSRKNPLFMTSLTLDQKLQYLHTALFFLSGFSVGIFYILPLLYVYFGWRAMEVNGGFATWAAHYAPYFGMILFSTAHLLGRWPRWRTYVMALGAFSAHISASLAVLTNMRLQWNPSGVIRSNVDYIKPVMVHLLLLLLSVGAIPILLASERSGSMAFLISLWLLWNTVTLAALCRAALPGAREREHGTEARPAYGYAPA